MAGTQNNNTMAEGLSKVMKDLSQMKLQPDADMQFLQTLEQDIVDYLKPPAPATPGAPTDQGAPQGPLANAMGSVMGGPTSPGPGPALGAMPNADEFRRMMGRHVNQQTIQQLGAAQGM